MRYAASRGTSAIRLGIGRMKIVRAVTYVWITLSGIYWLIKCVGGLSGLRLAHSCAFNSSCPFQQADLDDIAARAFSDLVLGTITAIISVLIACAIYWAIKAAVVEPKDDPLARMTGKSAAKGNQARTPWVLAGVVILLAGGIGSPSRRRCSGSCRRRTAAAAAPASRGRGRIQGCERESLS
jgi:hypothetical protein